MRKKLSRYKALTFDCYGTLIDWETGIWNALQPIITRNNCVALSRGDVLQQFAEFESQQQNLSPNTRYSRVLELVHHRFSVYNKFKTTDDMNQKFGASISKWPIFFDSSTALRILKSKYKLIVLSNVDRIGFRESNRKLGIEFDAVYTAEDIGSYKPDSRNFYYMLRRIREDFEFGKRDVLHVAQSLYHDHVPARKIGLANVWIDRHQHSSNRVVSSQTNWGATRPVKERPNIDFVFYTMEEFSREVVSQFASKENDVSSIQ
jgi:2-haloacid dehalogenase